MQPKVMQDVLNAMAKAYPTGIPAIVQFVAQQPGTHPCLSRHAQAVQLCEDGLARKVAGISSSSGRRQGKSLTFSRWIARHSALYRWEDHFTPEMLSLSPDIAIEVNALII